MSSDYTATLSHLCLQTTLQHKVSCVFRLHCNTKSNVSSDYTATFKSPVSSDYIPTLSHLCLQNTLYNKSPRSSDYTLTLGHLYLQTTPQHSVTCVFRLHNNTKSPVSLDYIIITHTTRHCCTTPQHHTAQHSITTLHKNTSTPCYVCSAVVTPDLMVLKRETSPQDEEQL